MAKANVKKTVKQTRAKHVNAKSPVLRERGKRGRMTEARKKALERTGFKKGNPGKAKGTKNKMGVRVKEAILEAAELCGENGRGKGGAVGYLKWLARTEPAVFGRMLERIMPMQVEVKDKTERSLSAPEAIESLEARGLPVPPSLRLLAEGIAIRQAQIDDAEYDAELNGKGFEGAEEGLDDDDDNGDGGAADEDSGPE